MSTLENHDEMLRQRWQDGTDRDHLWEQLPRTSVTNVPPLRPLSPLLLYYYGAAAALALISGLWARH